MNDPVYFSGEEAEKMNWTKQAGDECLTYPPPDSGTSTAVPYWSPIIPAHYGTRFCSGVQYRGNTDRASRAAKKRIELPRLIVCAAMLMKDGSIVTGIRHFSPEMRAIMRLAYGAEGYHLKVADQGFVDQKGVFLTREEAWKVAEAAGQIRRVTGSKGVGELYSEDLY